MAIAHNDRRFYVLDNPTVPADSEFFTELHEWLKTDWAQHVWRWFMKQEPDLTPLLNPAPLTIAKSNMVEATKSSLHVAIEAVFEVLPIGMVPHFQMTDILEPLFPRLGIEDANTGRTHLRAIMRDQTTPTHCKLRFGENSVRLRLIPIRLTKAEILKFKNATSTEPFIDAIQKIKDTDLKAVREAVERALISHDM